MMLLYQKNDGAALPYEVPRCEVIAPIPEGVVCTSVDTSNQAFVEDDEEYGW